MTQDLVTRDTGEVLITQEQLGIIKSTVCKDATDAEMQLYFYDCKRRGVHPLDRLIHFTKRGGRYVPITSIDFFYQRAHATNQFAGQDETVFRGKPGMPDFEATVRVHRDRGIGSPKGAWSATARWSEYYPGDQQGHMWKKMPNRMLEKCAEALALRKAFPAELQGLYVKEEMDQAGEDLAFVKQRSAPEQARPEKGEAVLEKMKKNGSVLVEQDGANTPPPFNPEVCPPADGITDETWQAFIEYVGDDPDRTKVGKKMKVRMSIAEMSTVQPTKRKSIILSIQDEAKRQGVPFSEWAKE